MLCKRCDFVWKATREGEHKDVFTFAWSGSNNVKHIIYDTFILTTKTMWNQKQSVFRFVRCGHNFAICAFFIHFVLADKIFVNVYLTAGSFYIFFSVIWFWVVPCVRHSFGYGNRAVWRKAMSLVSSCATLFQQVCVKITLRLQRLESHVGSITLNASIFRCARWVFFLHFGTISFMRFVISGMIFYTRLFVIFIAFLFVSACFS